MQYIWPQTSLVQNKSIVINTYNLLVPHIKEYPTLRKRINYLNARSLFINNLIKERLVNTPGIMNRPTTNQNSNLNAHEIQAITNRMNAATKNTNTQYW
tara:strand:- start:123 stop:419 length:297 start_codon:yes stop_codon:yes gene_type:complete